MRKHDIIERIHDIVNESLEDDKKSNLPTSARYAGLKETLYAIRTITRKKKGKG